MSVGPIRLLGKYLLVFQNIEAKQAYIEQM